MDNQESKIEFQKDCQEILSNIMGLFYLKKQEKIQAQKLNQAKLADPSKMTAKERREYQRSLWNQKNKVFLSFAGHDPIDDLIN